jgi:hypothetical protein
MSQEPQQQAKNSSHNFYRSSRKNRMNAVFLFVVAGLCTLLSIATNQHKKPP